MMGHIFRTTLQNAILGRSAATVPSLPFRAFQPCRTFYAFHPSRPTTVLKKLPSCPPYPYPARQTYKEADTGLYGGTRPQSGNKISKGKNKGKTLRRWHPNVRLEDIRSEALNTTMTIKITAAVMRTIRKCGGLDEYLLGDKPARIKELGLFGWQLRWRVMNRPVIKARLAEERKRLGVVTKPQFQTFEQAWEKDEELREEIRDEQKRQWQELQAKDEKFRRHMKSRFRPTKDCKTYRPGPVVPAFDEAAFDALIPYKPAPEQVVNP